MTDSSRMRPGGRAVAAGLGLGLAASALTVLTPGAAQAADPVTITLLNINDFHGRIDANTTKFATTVEQQRAAAGEANTLFLSAGDNIGASLFASNLQQDQPTIDVLNALDLAASAVGNHEFDKGVADLQGRVADAAQWDYLGANVYEKGTTTPALQEYATFEVAGLTVGVIGAVTEETPTLVTPSGVASVDFGNAVAAVNRVADQLSDGDGTNGEADVIVAEYHAGAVEGLPDGTLADEVSKGGEFAEIVNGTTAEVDAIFTGHTHQTYAWDAPVPGSSATRPLVQTGSYGANLGKIGLTYDADTDEVTAYTKDNVARAATEDLSFPRVAEVKAITDAALAHAAEVGNQPVGEVTADVTTAFSGGSYVDGVYTGGKRDDRASESTMGNLVADALHRGLTFGEPDLGLTNPGGMRAEFLYEGDTTTNPLNVDGVVTYAEANAVMTFANTVALVDVTGAELDAVLEQQWQPEGAQRPYLQLGLSENVRVTADPTRAKGDRITSIRLDGELVDPAATYTVSTLNFLATGGDNFTAFTQGEATDTGIVDIELFRDYLEAQSPISPDFARQQVEVTGGVLPETVSAGDSVSVQLAKLNLTSLGSPANTSVKAFAVQGDAYRELGSFPVDAAGTASVDLTAPADLDGAWGLSLLAEPSRTLVGAALPELESSVRASAVRQDFGKGARVSVTVDAPITPTGTVTVSKSGRTLGSAELAGGTATVSIPAKAMRPGARTVDVEYSGDDMVAGSATTTRVRVRRADPRIKVNLTPKRAKADRTRVRVRTKVLAAAEATGKVVVRTAGRSYRARLRNGKAVVRLRPFDRPGRYRVKVVYRGSALVSSETRTVTVKVAKNRGNRR